MVAIAVKTGSKAPAGLLSFETMRTIWQWRGSTKCGGFDALSHKRHAANSEGGSRDCDRSKAFGERKRQTNDRGGWSSVSLWVWEGGRKLLVVVSVTSAVYKIVFWQPRPLCTGKAPPTRFKNLQERDQTRESVSSPTASRIALCTLDRPVKLLLRSLEHSQR